MATRRTQHGASAKRGRSATSASGSSRARSSARSTPRKPAKSGSRTPAGNSRRRATSAARTSQRGYIIPLAIVVGLVIAAWSFYPVARLQYSEEREAARLEAELNGLKERNVDLRAQVDRLKTPEGVEEVARESLGLVKEGENLVVVVDGDEEELPAVTDPDTSTIPEPDSPVWVRVLDALFGFE